MAPQKLPNCRRIVFSEASVQLFAVGKTTTLVDELPKGGDGLLKPCVGHVGDRDGLPVEYAGWVRIVGT
jgi:hypothetical protein